MNRKIFKCYIIIQIILICVISGLVIVSREHRSDFFCKSEVVYKINQGGEKTKITANISLNFLSGGKIHAIAHGFVSDNAGMRIVNREYDYSYRSLDDVRGKYIGTLEKIIRNESDNDDRNTVSNYLFGGESSDVHFEISRISSNILVIGNVFTPVFSCTLTGV